MIETSPTLFQHTREMASEGVKAMLKMMEDMMAGNERWDQEWVDREGSRHLEAIRMEEE